MATYRTFAPQEYSPFYVNAMQELISVIQTLSLARDLDTVIKIVRDAARDLTHADGATFVLRDNHQCYYVDENAISPLWKGKRFPMSSCISGWSMLHSEPVVIEDIYQDDRIPANIYRKTFVKSLAIVPIRRNDPIGAIGNYWADQRLPSDEEVAILEALANITSVTLENVNLYTELQEKISFLEEKDQQILKQHESLEVFTRALAHDLREPLRTIHSFNELIQEYSDSTEEIEEYLKYIFSAEEHMTKLVNTVFHYVQIDSVSPQSKELCSVQQILETTKNNLQRLIRENNTLIEVPETLPIVVANQPQLSEMLQNLISNAINHSDKPIVITISAEEQADSWQFCIADNGPGIESRYLKRIFVPFKKLTNKDNCCGLGLTICAKIAEIHGGKIWCESKYGQGSKFYFTLAKKEAPDYIIDSANHKKQLANILLVDDSPQDIEIAKIEFFKRNHFQCNLFTAINAATAMDIIKKHQNSHDEIDLLLLDINLPGMDGFELLQHMRSEGFSPRIPVIIQSGSEYQKDIDKAHSLGVSGYIVKPLKFSNLLTIIKQIHELDLQDQEGTKVLYHQEWPYAEAG